MAPVRQHPSVARSRHGAAAGAAGGRAGVQAGKWSFNVAKKGHAAARQRLEPKLYDNEDDDDDIEIGDDREIDDSPQEAAASSGRRDPRDQEGDCRPAIDQSKARQEGRGRSPDQASTWDRPARANMNCRTSIYWKRLSPKTSRSKADEDALAENARLLESVLEDFGVQGESRESPPGASCHAV